MGRSGLNLSVVSRLKKNVELKIGRSACDSRLGRGGTLNGDGLVDDDVLGSLECQQDFGVGVSSIRLKKLNGRIDADVPDLRARYFGDCLRHDRHIGPALENTGD